MAFKPQFLSLLFFALLCTVVAAYPPIATEWTKTYGGLGNDSGQSVKQTSDGGYIIAGVLGSNVTKLSDPASGTHETDLWVIKTDPNGNQIWNKTYNFSDMEAEPLIEQTSDGGYIVSFFVIASLGSYNGGINLLKLDSDGNRSWNASLPIYQAFNSVTGIKQTSDGGYFVVINTGGKNSNFYQDIALFRLDSNGSLQWNKTIPTSEVLTAWYLRQTSDGGYIIVGGNHTPSFKVKSDSLVIKMDDNGSIQWTKTYNITSEYELATAVTQTSDGGYVMAGHTFSVPAQSEGLFATRMDSNGNHIWNITINGSDDNSVASVHQTSDGGYLLSANTFSSESSSDLWLIKLDSSGNVIWNQTLGGTGFDKSLSMEPTNDGGYIISGNTTSFGVTSYDALLLKLSPISIISFSPTNLKPNIAEPNNLSFNISINDTANATIAWYKNSSLKSTSSNFVFLGNSSASGFYNITVIVNRSSLQTSLSWNLLVNNTNTKPSINTTPVKAGRESELYTYAVNAIDSDGDTLTFSDNTSLFDINSSTGLISFTPSTDGNYAIKITVSDGLEASEQEYNLTIKAKSTLTMTILSPQNNSVVDGDSTTISVSTNSYANCFYSLDSGSFKNFSSINADFWQVKTSKKLELSEDLTQGGTNLETLRNITTFIDKNNLNALASGSITNSKNTSPYNQYLYVLGIGTETALDTGYVIYTEDDDTDTIADYLYYKSGREIGRYLLEFTTAFESGIKDMSGNLDPNGQFLPDFENSEIKILGKVNKIVYARKLNDSGVRLDLILNPTEDTLLEKQTKTYSIDGKSYDVTLNFLDSDEAQFIINTTTTRKLKENDDDKLSNGLIIRVKEIKYQDYAGGIHSGTFIIGTQKFELKDINVTDVASSHALKANDNTIDDALVIIEGSVQNSTFKIDRINVNMTADDNFFVPAGGKLSDAIKTSGGSTAEPEVLFTNNWDISYRGLSSTTTETVKLTTNGLSEYRLEFLDGDGNKVSLPIAKSPSGQSLLFGEISGRSFINKENRTINKDEYFILSDLTTIRGERKTYAFQYKGADKITTDNPVLKFKNLGTGATIEQKYNSSETLDLVGPNGAVGNISALKFENSFFKIYNSSSMTSNDFGILIDLSADGLIQSEISAPVVLTSRHGMEINITNETNIQGIDQTDIIFLTFKIPDDKRDGNSRDSVDSLLPTPVRLNITADSGEVRFNLDTNTEPKRLNFRVPSGKVNVSYAYDSYGNYYTYEHPLGDPSLMTIQVPIKQREVMVYYDNGKFGDHSSILSNLTKGQHSILINCTDAYEGTKIGILNFNVSVPFDIVSNYPNNGNLNVSIDTNVTFKFNKAINLSTLTQNQIIFENAKGDKVKFMIYYYNDSNKTVLDPHIPFLPDQTYSFEFKKSNPVKDLDGNKLDFGSITFRTSPKDTDKDGVPDHEDNDIDNDGVDDDMDFFKGNLSNLNSNFPNISMKVDSDYNISKIFNGTKKIEFFKGELKLLEFDYSFANSTKLDLSNISILNASNSSLGGVVVRGISLSKFGWKKTTYVERIDSSKNGLCIKDAEIDWIDNISSSCDGESEYKVECDGSSQNGYACTYNSTMNAYRVTGLSHSGALQLEYTQSSGSSSSSSGGSSSGGGSGGGGGGGGGAAGFICNMDWKCGDWSECKDGIQTKQCEFAKVPQHWQETECPSQSNLPQTSKECESKETKPAEAKQLSASKPAQSVNISKSNAITGAVVAKNNKPNYLIGLIGLLAISIAGFFIYKKFKS